MYVYIFSLTAHSLPHPALKELAVIPGLQEKWFDIGIALDLSEQLLHDINESLITASRKKNDMFKAFLKSSNPTWEKVIRAFQRCGELQLARDVCNAYELPLSLIEGEQPGAIEEKLGAKRVVTAPVQLAEQHVQISKYHSLRVESDSCTELHIQSDILHTPNSGRVENDDNTELHVGSDVLCKPPSSKIESGAGMIHSDSGHITHDSQVAADGDAEPHTGSDVSRVDVETVVPYVGSSPLAEQSTKSFVDSGDQYEVFPTLSETVVVTTKIKGHTLHDPVTSGGVGHEHKLSLEGDTKTAKPQQSPTFSGGSPKSESLEFHSFSDSENYGGALSLSEVPSLEGKSTFSDKYLVPLEKRPGVVNKKTYLDDDSGITSAVSSLSKSLLSQKGVDRAYTSEVSFSINMFAKYLWLIKGAYP